MKLMTRTLAALATVLLAGAMFAGTSSAGSTGDYFCDELNIGCPGGGGNEGGDAFATCSPTTLPAGASSSCTSEGLQEGAAITATFESDPVVVHQGTVKSSTADTFSFVVPNSAAQGAHTLTITSTDADGDPATAVVPYTVTGDVLARTGSNVGSTVAVGASLVLLGAAAVVGARKRRSLA